MQMILVEVLTDDNFISSLLDRAREKTRYSYYLLLCQDAAHIMTPGQSQNDLKPGMFRTCYCFVSLDV
jgi:hypothetical protein